MFDNDRDESLSDLTKGLSLLANIMRSLFIGVLCCASALAQDRSQKFTQEKRQLLWHKLQDDIAKVDKQLDGVLAVAVKDLTSGDTFFIHPDEVMPQASSIKIAVLAGLYLQAQQGKLKLTDQYVVRQEDIVPDSHIMEGLTVGTTRLTLRDLATMTVAVSDNSATNVLIDRVGMENVNAMLDSNGLHATRLRRKMMDLKAASEGRENVSTPREMMTLLETIYSGKLLNKEMTADFMKMLSTPKQSQMVSALPEDVKAANKPGELEAVRNDSGIVLVKGGPYVLCVMTTFLKHESEGEAAIRAITGLTFSYFDRVARASEYGRVVSPNNR